jgi:hypothetical protein
MRRAVCAISCSDVPISALALSLVGKFVGTLGVVEFERARRDSKIPVPLVADQRCAHPYQFERCERLERDGCYESRWWPCLHHQRREDINLPYRQERGHVCPRQVDSGWLLAVHY